MRRFILAIALLSVGFANGKTLPANQLKKQGAEQFKMIPRLYTAKEAAEEYHLREFDPGYPKTEIKLENLPRNGRVKIEMERPLIGETFHVMTLDTQKIIEECLALGQVVPFYSISGKGFFPGEKIGITFTHLPSRNKQSLSFIPRPIDKVSFDGNASLTCELAILAPTTYEFKFQGFDQNEKIKMVSKSGNEEIPAEINVGSHSAMNYYPGVVGKDGGVAVLTFNQSKGNVKKELQLPWGMELMPYAMGEK